MRKNKEKFLVYIHQEYFSRLCETVGAESYRECEDVRHKVYTDIKNFLQGETADVAILDSFTDSFGNKRKSIEIYRTSNFARIKNLKELKRLRDEKKKSGFVEVDKQ